MFGSESEVAIGQVLAAVFPSDNNREEFYRAKVLSVEKEKATRQITLEVSSENEPISISVSILNVFHIRRFDSLTSVTHESVN